MYKVKVYNTIAFAQGKPCDTFQIGFGHFVEIGYWLDDNGYNDSRFTVIITFEEKTN